MRDGGTGKPIKNVRPALLGGQAAMPEWSPDGKSAVFVRLPPGGRLGSRFTLSPCQAGDRILGDAGDIAVLPYNDGAFGQAVTIVPGTRGSEYHFYPSFSPDSRWSLFNSSSVSAAARGGAARFMGQGEHGRPRGGPCAVPGRGHTVSAEARTWSD